MNEKDESCGELVHVYVHAEAKCLFNRINEFSLAGYPAGTLFVYRRTTSTGEQIEGPPPPANSFFPKATATTLTEAAFESWMGAPKFQRGRRGFLMQSCSFTEY